MPCVAMDAALSVPFSAAISCVEWCKNNFENIAAMGGRQRTGIYVAAWGSNSLTDSDALRAVIQRAGARSLLSLFLLPASLGFLLRSLGICA